MGYNDGENFCFFPFTQMLLQPTGVISPCCWNQDLVYGVIPQDQLADIWNGQAIRQLRQEFLDGNPKTCAKQMQHIGCHKKSRRQLCQDLELTSIMTSGPKRLDVRLNGRCNLQCVMCDVWRQPNGIYSAAGFWELGPQQFFPFLEEMDVLGGEPFVQADTYRLIDEISAVNSRCTWAFVTNGNYKFNDAIINRLEKIKIRWIQVSLDSLDSKTYAKIRVQGELSRALDTLGRLKRYARRRAFEYRGFWLAVSICVQQLNWREIPQLLDYCLAGRLLPVLQFAYTPSSVSLLSLPRPELEEVYLQLESNVEKYGLELLSPIYLPVKEALA